MNPTIKARIESIRRGGVPEGYKRTKIGIVPNEWNVESLKSHLIEYRHLSNDIDKFDIYSSSRNGLMLQSAYYSQKTATQTNLGYKTVPNGYVTYRHMSDDNIFHFNINRQNKTILVSAEYPVFDTDDQTNTCFLITYLNSMARFRYFCRGQKMGGTRTRLYFNVLGDFKLAFPSISEQEKIAEILAGQDRVIALKEKLLAEKQKQKKYLMQQLLTAKKRLPGFSGEWKKVRMGTYVNFQVGYPFSSLHFNEEGKGLRLIKNRDLKTDDQIYYTTEHYSQDFVVTNGDVLIGMDGDFLPCVWNKGRALLNQRVGKIFVASGMDLMFSYYCLHIPLEKLSSKIGATTVKHLAHKDVESLFVFIPIEKPEQIAIAEILSTADKEIELLKKDIEQEKLKKKSLMQLLLTGIVRVL